MENASSIHAALLLAAAFCFWRFAHNSYLAMWIVNYQKTPHQSPRLETLRQSLEKPRYGLLACCWIVAMAVFLSADMLFVAGRH